MLTDRDKSIISWIQKYKSITVLQCTYIFFEGNYEGCRRRLEQLEDRKILKSYKNKFKNEKTYYIDKKLKEHELLVYDFIKEIYKRNGELLELKLQPRLLKDNIRPDAFIEFKLEDNIYFIFLEVDYTHYTDNIKLKLYEKLYKEGTVQDKCYGTFPILLIARPTESIRYNSSNFDLVYTDLEYKNLDRLLFY